jgi:hypothetical protein
LLSSSCIRKKHTWPSSTRSASSSVLKTYACDRIGGVREEHEARRELGVLQYLTGDLGYTLIGGVSMDLIADYIHPYDKGFRASHSQCRIRIYVSDDLSDAPVVICSKLANNPGPSVTEAIETIPCKVIKHHNLSGPVWIEHYPPEATNGRIETFKLVAFSSYKVREILRDGSRR